MNALLAELSQYAWLSGVVTYIFVPLALSAGGHLWVRAFVDIRWQPKRFVIVFAGMAIIRFVHQFIYPFGIAASTVFRLITMIPLSVLALTPQGTKRLYMMGQCLGFMLLNDVILAVCISTILPPNMQSSTWVNSDASVVPYMLFPMVVCSYAFSSIWRIARKKRIFQSDWMFYLFSIAAILVSVAFPFLPLAVEILPTDIPGGFTDLYFWVSILFSGLTIFLILYFTRAQIQYRRQLRENRTLRQQEQIYASIVAEQRSFRHNLMNMLYGMEGQILTGNMHTLHVYYDEMVRKTQLINNENIVSVQNLQSASVRGLFLAQMERAQAEHLPFYIAARPLHGWCRMSDADCCALLGVLLDNAREAARLAVAPFVSVEVRNEENMLEIVVRNTYAQTPDLDAMMLDGYTTKRVDNGVGLASARQLLSKHNQAQLQIDIQGQYVVQQLLLP